MSDSNLLVGDLIWLYCEQKAGGYVFSLTSSSVDSVLYCCEAQSRECPVNVPDSQGFTFEIQLRNRYKLQKRYRRLLEEQSKHIGDKAYDGQLTVAKMAAEAEAADNEIDQKRHLGRYMKYGQVIQLKQQFTDKYIHVSSTQTSQQDKNYMAVHLKDYNAKHAQFKILPRFKVKSEGDLVQVNDQLTLESVKSPEQYLHASSSIELDSYTRGCEINLGVDRSGLTIIRYRRPSKGDENCFKGGSCVRFYHKEIEAYVVAEGRLYKETETCHLRVEQPKTPSTEGTTFWQLEHQESILNGKTLIWEQQVRIRHMATRLYLTVNKEGQLGVTMDNMDGIERDPWTVFRLHSVTKEQGKILHGSYTRIQHVLTGGWLHGHKHESYHRHQEDQESSAILWDDAPLKQLSLSQECHYDDAFTMKNITHEEISRFNFVAGMVPSILKLSVEICHPISPEKGTLICKALKELKDYLIVNGEADVDRQKLLRNLQIIDMLKDIISKVNFERKTSTLDEQRTLVEILKMLYSVMQCYLVGESRINELYIAKHLPFFFQEIQSSSNSGKETSKGAMETITELIRNNRQIVDSISRTQVDEFIRKLHSNKDYRYLQVLGTLCVCDGTVIGENQNYILNKWLCAQPMTAVYLMKKSSSDRLGEIYITEQGKGKWKLHDFIQKNDDGKLTERYLFFENQLDLFGKLCAGRNKSAIDILTKDSHLKRMFTYNMMYMIVSNPGLPNTLRAKYCHLLITLYLEAGDNIPVIEKTHLTYDYRAKGRSIMEADKTVGDQALDMDNLKRWINDFLKQNSAMEDIEHGTNELMEEVLRLVYYLVKYGYYGDDLKVHVADPLLNLLDAKTDMKEFHILLEEANNTEESNYIENYIKKEKYICSPKAKVIVDVKLRALEVVELLMEWQLDKRLQEFIMKPFRENYNYKTRKCKQPCSKVLVKMFSESYSLNNNKQTTLSAQKALERVMCEDLFDEKQLTDILLDLTEYQYHKLVRKSLMLLNKFYSTRHNLIQSLIQTRLLIHEESILVDGKVKDSYHQLMRLIRSKIGQRESLEIVNILNQLKQCCRLDKDVDDVHEINQRIMINNGMLDVISSILKQAYRADSLVNTDLEVVVKVTLELYTVLTRSNHKVQVDVSNSMDSLLRLKGVEPQVAQLLTQAFRCNHRQCMLISAEQIRTIVNLVAQHETKVPELLGLLVAMVKDDHLGVPLKKNQNLVIKYIMENYRDICGILDVVVMSDGGNGRSNFLRKNRPALPESQTVEDDEVKLIYLIALVDLLATCAEGENSLIESICQTILPLQPVLNVLTADIYGYNVKRPFLRFLIWAYINVAGGLTFNDLQTMYNKLGSHHISNFSSVMADMSKDHMIAGEIYMGTPLSSSAPKRSPADTPKVIEYTGNCLLKPASSRVILKDSNDEQFCTIHYIFHAILPFAAVWLRQAPVSNEKDCQDVGEITGRTFVHQVLLFAEVMTKAKVISKLQHSDILRKAVVSAMTYAKASRAIDQSDYSKLYQQYQSLEFTEYPARALVSYHDKYREELTTNKLFNVFCTNLMKAYKGENTVEEQLGYCKGVPLDREYTEIGKDSELPLGKEFQKLVNCYMDTLYDRSSKLMDQLSFATNLTVEEQLEPDQVELDIKCLQILRAFVHNEERKIPAKKRVEKYKEEVKDAQDLLIEMDVVGKTLCIPERSNDAVIKEYFAFANSMLLFANPNSQKSFRDRFYGTREETFFFAVKNRMSKSVSLTKERRSLAAQFVAASQKDRIQEKALNGENADETVHGSQEEETDSQRDQGEVHFRNTGTRKQMSYIRKTLSSPYKMELVLPSIGSMESVKDDKNITLLSDDVLNNNISPKPASKASEPRDIEIIIEDKRRPQAFELAKFKDEGSVELMLNLLAKLCDGQYKDMQDYLRDQFDNYRSANLVADTTSFLRLLYTHIDSTNIDLVTQIFTTLNEMVAGNYENYCVVWENGFPEYVSYILRTDTYDNCTEEQILSLWLTISDLFLSMLEEVTSKSDQCETDIKAFVDFSIRAITVECYRLAFLDETRKFAETIDQALKVGFNYYFISQRLSDAYYETELGVDEDYYKVEDEEEHSEAYDEYCEAMAFYAKQTKCIEVLKDNRIQRVWFRVADQNLLEYKVKEELKWNIDRTSASNKLRDLMEWSDDIIADINHKKRVRRIWPVRVAMDYWNLWNNLCFFLSFVISVLTLLTWEANISFGQVHLLNHTLPQDIYNPVPNYPLWYQLSLHVIGGFHTFLSFVIVFGYWTSREVGLVDEDLIQLFRSMTSLCMRREDVTGRECKMELKTYVISLTTLYYLVFPVFSILGHLYYGYFFAFHLLIILHTSQILKRVILAITQNGKQLLLVAFLGIILLYQFSLVAFSSLRFAMDPDKLETPMYCSTLGRCFVTIVRYGLVGELFEKMAIHESGESNFTNWGKLVAYHVFFFIIITTIGLNLIFGIILDTFSELRTQQSEALHDMKTTCFICSRSAHEFESHTKGGFQHHVQKEHNMWDYIFFFMQLEETDYTDYTCVQLYVHKMKKENKLDFFPINQAKSLEGQDARESDEKIDMILTKITEVMDRYDKEKAERERQNEQTRQRKWEEENRSPSSSRSAFSTPGIVFITPSTSL